MPKYVAINLAANDAAYDALLQARVGQPYDHHYETLSAMQADQAAIGADITAYGGLIIEGYHDWPEGCLDGEITFSGWTSSDVDRMTITAAPGHEHTGKPYVNYPTSDEMTGFGIKNNVYNQPVLYFPGMLYHNVFNLIIDGKGTQTRGRCYQSTIGSHKVNIDRCFFIDGVYQSIFLLDYADVIVTNTFAISLRESTYGFSGFNLGRRSKGIWYNCGYVDLFSSGNSADGFFFDQQVSNFNHKLKNCLSQQSGTKLAFRQSGTAGTLVMENNASNDGTADDYGGSDNRANQTFTFVDAAAVDLHLDPSDTGAHLHGQDLSADPDHAFNHDIDGLPRIAPWDIGPDQVITGGGIVVPKMHLPLGRPF